MCGTRRHTHTCTHARLLPQFHKFSKTLHALVTNRDKHTINKQIAQNTDCFLAHALLKDQELKLTKTVPHKQEMIRADASIATMKKANLRMTLVVNSELTVRHCPLYSLDDS